MVPLAIVLCFLREVVPIDAAGARRRSEEQCNIRSKRLRQVRITGHPPSKNMEAEGKWMQDEIKRQKSRHELRFYEVEGVAEERKGVSGHSSVTIRVRSLSS